LSAKVLKETRLEQRDHAARDDRRHLRHALPPLVVVGTIRLVPLPHESNVLIRSIALHLSEAHGSDLDAAGADEAKTLVRTEAVSPH
jgi:hypothetical protein